MLCEIRQREIQLRRRLKLTYSSLAFLALVHFVYSYSTAQVTTFAQLSSDTTQTIVPSDKLPYKDSSIEVGRIIDSVSRPSDSLSRLKSHSEPTPSIWDIVGKIYILNGLLGGTLLIFLATRLVKWYSLRFSPYLNTITLRFAEYEHYDDLDLSPASSEDRNELETGNPQTTISAVIGTKLGVQVLGKPGSGKTTSLKKLLRSYAIGELQKRWWKRTLPVYIEYRGDSVFNQILHFLHTNRLGRDIKYLDDKWLRNQLSRGKFLILIDDVHKILGNPNTKDQSKLQELLEYRLNRFVLMSRDFFKRSDFGFPIYEVSPLTNEKVLGILRLHTSESNAQMIFPHVQWGPRVRGLYDTPQMLSFLAKAFERNGRIPLNKSSMFTQFFDLQNEQEELRGAKYPRTLKRRILGNLALFMLRQVRDPYGIDEQECLRVLNEILTTLKSTYGFNVSDTVDFLNELLRTGSIIKYDQKFTFPHDQWQEYFAASELFELDANLGTLKHLSSFDQLAYFMAGFHSLEGDPKVKERCRTFLYQLSRLDFFLFSKCLENFKSDKLLTLLHWHDLYRDVAFSAADIENAYGEFLEDYVEIINQHFPHLRRQFSPHSEKAIGVFVEKQESQWGNWYAFFEVEPENGRRVIVVERSETAQKKGIEDENQLLDSYRRQYGTLNFKARDLDPVLFKLPLIGAHIEIESQLKELIERKNLVEPFQLVQERLYYESSALKTTLGISKDKRDLAVKDIMDALVRQRIKQSIWHKYLNGTSIDVRALDQETETLFLQGFVPERRRVSTVLAGNLSRMINTMTFEDTFLRFVRETELGGEQLFQPPLRDLPIEYFYNDSKVYSDQEEGEHDKLVGGLFQEALSKLQRDDRSQFSVCDVFL